METRKKAHTTQPGRHWRRSHGKPSPLLPKKEWQKRAHRPLFPSWARSLPDLASKSVRKLPRSSSPSLAQSAVSPSTSCSATTFRGLRKAISRFAALNANTAARRFVRITNWQILSLQKPPQKGQGHSGDDPTSVQRHPVDHNGSPRKELFSFPRPWPKSL